MIELYIDNKPVDIPENITAEIEYDNPFFTKDGSFSLEIELPLSGSCSNRQIFGHINRLDVTKEDKSFSAVMRVAGRLVFVGVATVVKVNDKDVSIQLLGGNSAINFYSESIYIDSFDTFGKLYLQVPAPSGLNEFWMSSFNTDQIQKLFASVDSADAVFFPASDSNAKNIRKNWYINPNNVLFRSDGTVTVTSFPGFSIQPYLIVVIRKLFNARGFSIIRNDIENSWMKNIYIVNSVYNRACQFFKSNDLVDTFMAEFVETLPHWNFNKFLTEIENFLGIVIVVDDNLKNVQIIDKKSFYSSTSNYVYIDASDVLDEYEFNISDSESTDNMASGNVGYKRDFSDKYLQVDKSILEFYKQIDYDNLASLQTDFPKLGEVSYKNNIFYVKDSNRTYIAKKDSISGIYSLAEINIFGPIYRTDSDSIDVQMSIVPANSISYDLGIHDTDEPNKSIAPFIVPLPVVETEETENISTKTPQELIEASESAEKEETTDEVMSVAINTGQLYSIGNYRFPVAFTDFRQECSATDLPEMSLSLNDVCKNSIGHRYSNFPKFDTTKPFTIKFMSDIPYDPKNVFVIKNRKFVAYSIKTSYDNHSSRFIYEGKFFRMD